MQNEKFFNYYVEILTSTLQEAIGKNLVYQAQSKIAEEELAGLRSIIENNKVQLENSEHGNDSKIATLTSTLESINSELERKNVEFQKLFNEYNTFKTSQQNKEVEFEALKSQLEQKLKEIQILSNDNNTFYNSIQEKEKQIISLNSQKELELKSLKKEMEDQINILKEELNKKIEEIELLKTESKDKKILEPKAPQQKAVSKGKPKFSNNMLDDF